MELIISVLAYQNAQKNGRAEPCEQDYIWAQENLSYFESHQKELGFGLESENSDRKSII